MAKYQFCDIDIEEMWDVDDDENNEYISINEYIQSVEALPEESIKIPEEYQDLSPMDSSDVCKNGDISRMLQSVPGILPAVDRFPPNYIPPTPEEQPDIIINDRIPILLHEKYFTFPETYGGNSNNGSSSSNTSSTEVLGFSEEDNNAVPGETSQIGIHAQIERKPMNTNSDRKYYNPKEIYMMKRGNKQSKWTWNWLRFNNFISNLDSKTNSYKFMFMIGARFELNRIEIMPSPLYL